jgi:hypothetical protein
MMTRSKLWCGVALAALSLSVAGCGLLDVNDPTAIEEADLANPDGAELLRVHAVTEMYNAVSQAARNSGLVSDELFAFPSKSTIQTGSVWNEQVMDMRLHGPEWASNAGIVYNYYQATRMAANHAIAWYRRYGVPAQRAHLGQMLAVRGYAILGLAEQVCPGFALHDVENSRPRYGPPLTTEQVFARALVDLDSAVIYAADSARFLHFAQVVRARTLLGLGQFAEAAQAAAPVPTTYVFNAEYSLVPPGMLNWLWRINFSATGDNMSVSDLEGGNGLDFISANDPRAPVVLLGTAHDGTTQLYAPANHRTPTAPIVIASGIEARLIEAEAQLAGEAPGDWLATLNDLRQTAITPALAPLTDPGTAEARVDLLFRERGFWLFLTGHRLGDLRRLVNVYGRAAESVFPSGAYHVGGSYGRATSMPFVPTGEEGASTGVTGCTD